MCGSRGGPTGPRWTPVRRTRWSRLWRSISSGRLTTSRSWLLPYGVVEVGLRGDQDDGRMLWELIRRTSTSWYMFGTTYEPVSVTQLPEPFQNPDAEPEADMIQDRYGDAPAIPGVDDSVTTMTIRLHQPPAPLSRLRRFCDAEVEQTWRRARRARAGSAGAARCSSAATTTWCRPSIRSTYWSRSRSSRCGRIGMWRR